MKRLLTVVLLGVLFASCKKSNDDDSASSTNFTSYQQYDINAQWLGSVGNAGDDYKMEEWPDWVYALFQPLDTVNLAGYNKSEVNVQRLYPNPCADTQILETFATQPVNLKIAIIDQFKKVYVLKSFQVASAQHTWGLSYRELGMGNAYYRLFYTFSAEGHPNFSRGHIDIYKTQ